MLQGGHAACILSNECSDPDIGAESDIRCAGSSGPILATLPLHRDAGGIADLDLDRARTGSIGAVHLLGDEALGAKPASMRENDRAMCSLLARPMPERFGYQKGSFRFGQPCGRRS